MVYWLPFLVHWIFLFFEFFCSEKLAIAMLTAIARLISVYLLVTLQQIQSRKLLLIDWARKSNVCSYACSDHTWWQSIDRSQCTCINVIAIAMSDLNVQHHLTQEKTITLIMMKYWSFLTLLSCPSWCYKFPVHSFCLRFASLHKNVLLPLFFILFLPLHFSSLLSLSLSLSPPL